LLHQVRKIFPKIPAVFADTGLEYPEIRDFVKTVNNVVWLKPDLSFREVLNNYGYPVISKKISRAIRDLKNPTSKNINTRNLYLTGKTRDGVSCPTRKLPKKWLNLMHAPFKISEQCCDVFKKKPMRRYERETNRKPIIGTMAEDSSLREKVYLTQGCNAFNAKYPNSTPMAFWKSADVWEYIKKYNIPYCKIYDMGESHTGCMFCLFGVHLEKNPNRFQRMQLSHPSQYRFCMDVLGIQKMLSFLRIEYANSDQTSFDF
jgi:3'-phosphoadenosine 5'-phosphosulfate sulfotransferase (PAPS reductase)/FAD synthetase